MHDLLLNTLVTKQAQFSPSVLDIVARTRALGLHKVAAHTHNCAEYGLPEVIKELGTKLAYAHLKQQKIASGLTSLRDLHADNTIKLADIGRWINKGTQLQNLLQTGRRKVAPGSLIHPGQTIGGSSSIGKLPSMPPGAPAQALPMQRMPTAPPPTAAPHSALFSGR
jgi:hypothetical protein